MNTSMDNMISKYKNLVVMLSVFMSISKVVRIHRYSEVRRIFLNSRSNLFTLSFLPDYIFRRIYLSSVRCTHKYSLVP